jgi:hypothetical protein
MGVEKDGKTSGQIGKSDEKLLSTCKPEELTLFVRYDPALGCT